MRTIVWFRGKDLRLADHEPLLDAIRAGETIPVFVVDPFFFAPERAAELPHRMQFLIESLHELAAAIEARGSRPIASSRIVGVSPWGSSVTGEFRERSRPIAERSTCSKEKRSRRPVRSSRSRRLPSQCSRLSHEPSPRW